MSSLLINEMQSVFSSAKHGNNESKTLLERLLVNLEMEYPQPSPWMERYMQNAFELLEKKDK